MTPDTLNTRSFTTIYVNIFTIIQISSIIRINFILVSRHFQDGAFARLEVHNSDSSKTLSVHTGFIPKSRPALVLTASNSSIALVGNARIEGGTALKQGRVSYSTNYKMRATKEAFYDTVFVSDTLPYFKELKYYPELSRNSFEKKFDKQSCVFDGTDKISSELKCSMVVMQGPFHLKIVSLPVAPSSPRIPWRLIKVTSNQSRLVRCTGAKK